MYLPDHFKERKLATALQLMRENPFATVITLEKGAPFINHLPLLIEERDGEIRLSGHMSRHNPQWRHLADDQEASIVFHGPHSYITPRWYASSSQVPTWNYAVVHARGGARLIDEFKELVGLLKRMSEHFERDTPSPWRFTLPADLKSAHELCAAIVGFELTSPNLEAKFKLSQNRDTEDQLGVIEGLATRSDEMSAKVRALMRSDRDDQ